MRHTPSTSLNTSSSCGRSSHSFRKQSLRVQFSLNPVQHRHSRPSSQPRHRRQALNHQSLMLRPPLRPVTCLVRMASRWPAHRPSCPIHRPGTSSAKGSVPKLSRWVASTTSTCPLHALLIAPSVDKYLLSSSVRLFRHVSS